MAHDSLRQADPFKIAKKAVITSPTMPDSLW